MANDLIGFICGVILGFLIIWDRVMPLDDNVDQKGNEDAKK